ncbi:uncharacterized protein LOC113237160 [Hyposmocoma kahamanoa]|uniref:uncharacterized protein LOC113237160 n=1 Tax=Hyposmocoma kahamanoa TaxID=1477025 RepID=UPI000E6D72D5|nr:uncharacterized protein LOC113237160 [Hyposmocoma kahamanoa]
MSSKVLLLFAVLCLLGSCWGKEEITRGLTRHEDIPIEPIGVPSDPDLNQDATFWRLWKFWKWGRSMFKKVLTRSHDMAESASGRHRFHEDRPNGNRKLKNKIKFLFKIHQYETN